MIISYIMQSVLNICTPHFSLSTPSNPSQFHVSLKKEKLSPVCPALCMGTGHPLRLGDLPEAAHLKQSDSPSPSTVSTQVFSVMGRDCDPLPLSPPQTAG